MLRVIGRAASINVRKVLWTCAELNLPFEREDAPPAAELQALNPNGLVPVLRDGDFVLWESNTIIRYLAASHGDAAFYPAAPRERARVDQWLDWQATDLNGSWSYAFMALVRQSATHRDPAAIQASVANWSRHIGILERQLDATGAFVAGARFTLADIAIGLSVHRWFATPLAHPEFPGVAAYYARLSERAGYRAHGRNGSP